ncbi:MAG: flavin reductase family protein [Rubrivivax sp.]|jgi:flavin reductase (DIM6/NTAB) family NADH-FMN oxidoreductase RutF
MLRQQAPFEPRSLRQTLGIFVTGVTVITTRDPAGKVYGLTANSFSTVSLEPPLILWSQAKRAGSYAVFKGTDEFAISILAEHQADISTRFASAIDDKFEGVPVDEAFCGLPVIEGSSAWLYCRSVSQFDGGDHTVYIGEVLKVARGDRLPLVFGGGRYLVARPADEVAPSPSAG